MSVSKIFSCANCDADGKIIIKGNELSTRDIVCCPICGASIWDDEDADLENE